MFHFAPLPSWKSIFSIFSLRSKSDKQISSLWSKQDDKCIWFSKSTWSLLAIAIWKSSQVGKNDISFWIPDYFCNSSLILLRKFGVKLIFYPINKNYEPDYSTCRELVQTNSIDVFLFVHYFGKPYEISRAFDFCKLNNAILVEDAVHVLYPVKGVGDRGDFVLYSPHKHFAIPDGAIMVIKNKGPSKLNWNKEDQNLIYENIIQHYFKFKNTNFYLFTWFFKRILQKIGFKKYRRLIPNFLNYSSPEVVIYPLLSNIAKKMLLSNIKQIQNIRNSKNRISLMWDEIVYENIQPEQVTTFNNSQWTPYLSKYTLLSKNSAKSFYELFGNMGVPVTTWPDLPLEILENSMNHEEAINLRNTSVFFINHPSISEKKIADLSIKTKNKLPQLDTRSLDQSTWEQEIKIIEQPNLLQSWLYGDAKKTEHWKVERITFIHENKKIALVQILSKRFFKIFTVIRINRGPLFYPNTSQSEIESVIKLLSTYGSIFKLTALFFNPELLKSGKNFISLYRNKFIRLNKKPWSSSYIDLTLSEDLLRKNLSSSWRNKLNSAEINDIQLKVATDDESFNWMLEKYSENMKDKSFHGIPILILKMLRSSCQENEKPLVLIAYHNGNRVAGICLSLTQKVGLYLVGWNGLDGRNLRANQFLIWNAILELKKRGFKWFDLGGIDEDNTPLIADFKLGVGGKRYELIGEYLKI